MQRQPSFATTLGNLRSSFSSEFGKHEKTALHLASFLGPTPGEREYFKTHLKRYLLTLELVPHAGAAQSALEIGSGYHHLTFPLFTLKGFKSVRCMDVWAEATARRHERRQYDGKELEFVVDNCDAQRAPWPYEDAVFDFVICAEVLEHLNDDPMCMLAEINRVLKNDALLLLTTPNVACAKSIECILRGESPYVFGQFEIGGGPADRHSREYTRAEVSRLLAAAGFSILRLETKHVWWTGYEAFGTYLAGLGLHVTELGDDIFCVARKISGVVDRYPEEFYSRRGLQSQRRTFQEGDCPKHKD